MELQELVDQCMRDTERWFPGVAKSAIHHGLSLAGEAGEVCNLLKKVDRGSASLDELRDRIAEEGVDALIYLACLFAVLGVDPEEVYWKKRVQNEQRFGTAAAALDTFRELPEFGVKRGGSVYSKCDLGPDCRGA